MGRPRIGAARKRKGVWRAAITLRDRTRYEWPVHRHPEGLPLTEAWVRAHSLDMQARYDAGLWVPEPVAARAARGPTPADPLGPDPTVLALARAWIGEQSYSSQEEDRKRLERDLAPADLAALHVRDVRPRHVVGYVEWLKKKPSRRGGTLSARAVRDAYSIARRVFAHAVLLELIEHSPCALPRRVLPALTDKVPGARAGWVFTSAEVNQLGTDDRVPWPRRVRWTLLARAGVRFGEAAALRLADWDRRLEPLTGLHVSKSIERHSRREKSVKTKVPRVVPVHPALEAVLRAWVDQGWRETFGRDPAPGDYLLGPDDDGGPLRVDGSGDALARDLTALGLRVRHQHCLRRTFVSRCRDGGARTDVLQWVSHGSQRSIVDVYSTLSWETLCGEVLCWRDPVSPVPPATAAVPPGPGQSPGSNAARFATGGGDSPKIPEEMQRARQDSNASQGAPSREFPRGSADGDGRIDPDRPGFAARIATPPQNARPWSSSRPSRGRTR